MGFFGLFGSESNTTQNYRYNYAFSEATATDSYNVTSNNASNISGSGNTYNLFDLGGGGGGTLATTFGLGLEKQMTGESGSAAAAAPPKWLLWAGGGLVLLLVYYLWRNR